MNYKIIIFMAYMVPTIFLAEPQKQLAEEIQQLEAEIIKEQEKYNDLYRQVMRFIYEDPFSEEVDRWGDLFVQQMVKICGMKNRLKELKEEMTQQ